jgi:alpha-L-fucosidase
MKKVLLIIFISMTYQVCNAQKIYEPNWESIDSRPLPAWFEDAKFGIFIHWGLYSVPSWGPTDKDFKYAAGDDWHKRVGMKYSEWYWHRINTQSKDFGYDVFQEHHEKTYGKNFKYQDFAKDFKAENFQPNLWAEIFKSSGAKYVVLTSKHHEGFALWPSKYSWNWNAGEIGPKKDILGELSSSVKAKGLKMGYYYSLYEWFNPLYTPQTLDSYVDSHMIPQMKELVTNYKPDILWGDGQWGYSSDKWKMPQFMSWLYNESPVKDQVVINDRWGKDTWGKHGGFYSVEYGNLNNKNADLNSIEKPWEECRGVGFSFGYNRNENLKDYSTSEQLVEDLIKKVSSGGNLLLNVGPTSDGRIPVIMQQRLADIGAWLDVNGEGIYGTRKWANAPKVTPETKQYFTQKGNDLYLITTEFPSGSLQVAGIKKPVSVSLLGSNVKIKSSFKGSILTIAPPAITPGTNPCQYAWVIKLTGALMN